MPMNNQELKEYLCEKIDTNHAHTTELLRNLVAQTTKTNGRVTTLEDEIWEVVKAASTHVQTCPQKIRIDNLEEENLEQRIIKKYPKLAFGVLIALVCLSLFGVYTGYVRVNDTLDSITKKQILIQKELQLIK